MIELMVVVVLVAVLAGIAVPIYGSYTKKARVSEAQTRMGEILTAAKTFAGEHPGNSGAPQWPPVAGEYGIVTLNPSESFDYAITSGGGADALTTPMEITATGTGRMAGVTVKMTVPNVNANGEAPVITGI